jgi:hypothetical protein
MGQKMLKHYVSEWRFVQKEGNITVCHTKLEELISHNEIPAAHVSQSHRTEYCLS